MSAIEQLIDALTSMGLDVATPSRRDQSPGLPTRCLATAAEVRRARELLARLQSLAPRLRADERQPPGQVGAVNRQLRSAHVPPTEEILDAIRRLVAFNEQLKRRLAESEAELGEQAPPSNVEQTEARTDSLTGLASRHALNDELRRRVAESQCHGDPLCVVQFGLDRFQELCDALGPRASDEILRGVARVLRQTMGESDLVARYGGEAFTTVLPGATLGEARRTADRARRGIQEERFEFHGRHVPVTTSVGIAELAADEDAATLLRRADEALSAAKQAGRDCTHWHDGNQALPAKAGPSAAEGLDDASLKGTGCDEEGSPAPPAKETAADGPGSDKPGDGSRGRRSQAGQAPRDAVDGWCNWTAFCQRVRQHILRWRQGGPTLSAMLIDVDGYDRIVARHGLHAGAQVASAVRTFLAALARDHDVLADCGQGTFGVLLLGTAHQEAVALAQRLRRAIHRYEVSIHGTGIRFTISVGIAQVAENDTLIGLLTRAGSVARPSRRSGTPAEPGAANGPFASIDRR